MRLANAATFLGVAETVLEEFSAVDSFNDGNTFDGFISQQSDHRYGALVVWCVNGQETEPQAIYCTPKLHYPFDKSIDGRRYKWPKFQTVAIYEKLDGSNILNYSYADANGKRYSTFKTRLTPVLKASKFGDFRALWEEVLQRYPELRRPAQVLSGEYAFSYELYGYRNPHLILYENALDAKFLFAVRQSTAAVCVPEKFREHPLVMPRKTFADNKEDLVKLYESLREEAEAKNKKTDDGTIQGTEGCVFYVFTDEGIWLQYKMKPDSVETIHWASDTLPEETIAATAWNALESCEGDLTTEYVAKLLREEFTEHQVKTSWTRIEKVVAHVVERAKFRGQVLGAYRQVGVEFTPETKGQVMRALAQHFTRDQMKTVYSALRELGIAK